MNPSSNKFPGQNYSIPNNSINFQPNCMPLPNTIPQNASYPQSFQSVPNNQFIPNMVHDQGNIRSVSNQYNNPVSFAQQVNLPFQVQRANPSANAFANRKQSEEDNMTRRKLEQQQKFKALKKSGIKPALDADTYMRNIVGPIQVVKVNTKSGSEKHDESFGDFVHCESENAESRKVMESAKIDSSNPKFQPSSNIQVMENKFILPTPKQDIDSMMAKYTDLNNANQTSNFKGKKSVMETAPAKVKNQQYAQSNKACDWSKVSLEMENKFQTKKGNSDGLPNWCCKENVPEFYHEIEMRVLNNENKIDTSLLYPLLISSELPQPVLAFIWGLTNVTQPGQLTQKEFYCTLALIAVAQAGHSFQNIDVLNYFQQAPIPKFCTDSLHSQNVTVPTMPVAATDQSCDEQSISEISSGSQNPASDSVKFDSSNINLNKNPALNQIQEINSDIQPFNQNIVASCTQPQSTVMCDAQQVVPNPVGISSDVSAKDMSKNTSQAIPSSLSFFEQKPTPNFNESIQSHQIDLIAPKITSANYRKAAFEQENNYKSKSDEKSGDSLLQIASIKSDKPSGSASSASVEVDEDFDDFISAPVNDSVANANSVKIEDEFDDFQYASTLPTEDLAHKSNEFDAFKSAPEDSVQSVIENFKKVTNDPVPKTNSSDLISMDQDKYSAFRELSLSMSTSQDKEVIDDESSNLEDKTVEVDHEASNLNSEIGFTADFSKCEETPSQSNQFGDFVFNDKMESKAVENIKLSVPQLKNEASDITSNSSFEFCEFESNSTSLKPIPSLTDCQSIASLDFDQGFSSKKDNISLGESQSVASLEFGNFVFDGGQSSESKSPVSKSDSTSSLELKTLNESCEFGEMVSANEGQLTKSTSVLNNPMNNGFFVDKYSVVRKESQENLENKCEDLHTREWCRCLQSCYDIIKTANSILNDISSKTVCNEVLSTEEGGSYYKNVIEVYRVVKRISLSVNSFKKNDDKIDQVLKDIDLLWNNLVAFVSGTTIMPEESSLDFSAGIISETDHENQKNACGVCLLNVDSRSKMFDREEDDYKIIYAGRKYHSSCANLWVNCVNSMLPSLPIPHIF